jgi:glycosyltransferase involved in cell wall biosynthesis
MERFLSKIDYVVSGGKIQKRSCNCDIKATSSKDKICFIGKKVMSMEEVAGPHMGSFYLLQELIKRAKEVSCFDSKNFKIKNILNIVSCDSIWLVYPVGRKMGFLTALISIMFNKRLIVFVNDLPVLQARDLTLKEKNFSYTSALNIIEFLLFSKADVVVSTSPYFFEYLKVNTKKRIVFPPGICSSDLEHDYNNGEKKSGTNVLVYAGSLDRSGMITKLSTMFSNIEDWQLWIAGEGNERIDLNNNVKYLGLLPKVELYELYKEADAIIIPYPRLEYYEIVLPLKTGEVLATGKPIITKRLKGIQAYLHFLGVEERVIFVENWSEDELLKAIEKAKILQQSPESGLKKRLLDYTWENRVPRLMDLVGSCEHFNGELRWV